MAYIKLNGIYNYDLTAIRIISICTFGLPGRGHDTRTYIIIIIVVIVIIIIISSSSSLSTYIYIYTYCYYM